MYRSFDEIYNECNNVSQFKGSTQKIIDDAVNKLEIVRKTYRDEYVSDEIRKVLKVAQQQLDKNRDTFLSLLRNELDKASQQIPNNLSSKDYTDKDLRLLEYQMKSMSNDELLAFNGSTDEVACIVAKGMLADRCNVLEGHDKQQLYQAMRQMAPTTKETLLQGYIDSYNALSYDNLYPGESFGSTLSKQSQGGMEAIILQRAGIDKVKHIEVKNDDLSNMKYNQQYK